MDCKTLVVDGDAAAVEEVADVLASLGHNCDVAGSQEEARARVAATDYTCILLISF